MNENHGNASGVLLVILLVVVVGLVATVGYQYLARASVERQIALSQQALTANREAVNKYAGWRKDYERLAKKLGERMPACTWSEQMAPMVTRLTDIAWQQKIKIETLQPEPAVTIEQITRFPLRISLHADLARLTPMLQALRTTTPALQIDKLDIRTEPAKDNLLKVEMTVASFVIVEKQASADKKKAKKSQKSETLPEDAGSQTETTSAASEKKPTGSPAVGLPMVSPAGRPTGRATPRGTPTPELPKDTPAAEAPRGGTR